MEITVEGLDGQPFQKLTGNISARIAFVGCSEPGEKYPYLNPFAGQEDVLLSQLMHTAGIIKTDCYFTNSLVKEELAQIKANVIVAVGGKALMALTGKKPITKQRGSIIESTLLPGKKVIPILHPTPTLKQYLWRWPVIYDLRRIKAQSEFPEIRRPERTLHTFPTFTQAMAFLEYIHKEQPNRFGCVYYDTEIMNQEVSHVSFAVTPNEAMSIDFGPGRFSEQEEIELWLKIAAILEDPNIPKAGQNLMFDNPMVARKNGIIARGKIYDNMIVHHWTYPDFPKGLDFQTSIYTEEPYYKDEGKAWKTGQFDDQNFALYSAKDACTGLECLIKAWEQAERMGTIPAHEITTNAFPIFTYMSLRGIKADQKSLADTKKIVNEKMSTTLAELHKIAGFALNPASSKQCAEYFYIKKGLKPYMNRGSITTDDKAMTRIAAKGFREARLIQDYRGYKKLDGTYLDIAFDADSRLRCSVNPAGTRSGRVSTSQTIFGTGTNLQNLPPEFKQFLKADDGMLLIEVDKVQAEWIDTAYRCGDANMIEVAEKKLDAHVKTAQMMNPGMPVELILKDNELLGHEIDEVVIQEIREKNIPEILKYNPIRVMSCRQIAKKCNHGLNYDMGYKTFALTANIPEGVSKVMVEKYHRGYPGIRQWHGRIREQLQRDRTLINNFGRVRKFMDRWGDNLHKAAIAHLPQSDVADLVNIGLYKIYKMQGGVMKYVDPLIQVHDSFLFQYPLDRLHDLPTVIRLMFHALEPVMRVGGRNFVIPTDMKIGFDWKHMKGCAFSEDDSEHYENLVAVINKLQPKTASEVVEELLKEVTIENEGEDRQEVDTEVLGES